MGQGYGRSGRRARRRSRRERGSAYFVVTVLAVVATIMVGTHLTASLSRVRATQLQVYQTSAFNAAESGLNVAIQEFWALYNTETAALRVSRVIELADLDNEEGPYAIRDRRVGRSLFDVEVVSANSVGTTYADVEFRAWGRNERASRTITTVVRFGLRPSRVFDHAYFINNFGWLYGAGITVNGSIRSAGNIDMKNAVVNGDIYASENEELGAEGAITGDYRFDTVDHYNAHAPATARPTNPTAPPEDTNGNGILDIGEDTNGNGVLDDFDYIDGYDGNPRFKEHQHKLEMPYLGELDLYKEIAVRKGGTITQSGITLVENVLGDDAGEPDGMILIGTPEDPIVVNGPVVITGDLVIKGTITGHGTIYTGRNVHVIGDVSYADPPTWPKPCTDIEALTEQNAAKDMVGFSAKGSIVIGDYTNSAWLATTRNYLKPPFTQAYRVDPTDDLNGYVSYYDAEGNPTFDGDYIGYDGGTKDPDAGDTERPARKFYESSFADDLIASLCDSQVQHMDGVFYTNHLLAGKAGAISINGTLVSRDEAIIYNGSMDINYDVRVRHGSYAFLDIDLPMEPHCQVLFWSEGK